ncbi:hypothetical protein BDR03DRAFT_981846 [Suillus americanus]|nr:hypothetical protein BDR03DRAFT_981846 [Suillus americanus]
MWVTESLIVHLVNCSLLTKSTTSAMQSHVARPLSLPMPFKSNANADFVVTSDAATIWEGKVIHLAAKLLVMTSSPRGYKFACAKILGELKNESLPYRAKHVSSHGRLFTFSHEAVQIYPHLPLHTGIPYHNPQTCFTNNNLKGPSNSGIGLIIAGSFITLEEAGYVDILETTEIGGDRVTVLRQLQVGCVHRCHLAAHNIYPNTPTHRPHRHLDSSVAGHCMSYRTFHDDDSALVDRAVYETSWCFVKTWDMGPPDGWYYERRHTLAIQPSGRTL